MDTLPKIDDLTKTNELFWQKHQSTREILHLYKENADLRTAVSNLKRTIEEERGTRPSINCQETVVESQFQKDLQQPKVKHEKRTSSPVDFKSFILSSVHTDAKERDGPWSSCTEILPEIKDPGRIFGEIAFQLDRRILAHTFPCQKRLYGFTLFNVQDKIRDVSTHSLTGKVNEDYRLLLTQRYTEIQTTLQKLGYKPALHPAFSEFIVNTFGILKERPEQYSNPDILRQLINTRAQKDFVKDLQLLLTCLCKMSDIDKKPFFLWSLKLCSGATRI